MLVVDHIQYIVNRWVQYYRSKRSSVGDAFADRKDQRNGLLQVVVNTTDRLRKCMSVFHIRYHEQHNDAKYTIKRKGCRV